jgi:outer membrane biosynthesis protein TonB
MFVAYSPINNCLRIGDSMTVNLSDVGGQLLKWLGLLNEQMDTSKLQERVRTNCCSKPFESRETAMGSLMDLSELLRKNGFNDQESELQIIIAKKIDELAHGHIEAPAKPKLAQPLPSQPKVEEKACAEPVQAQSLPSNPQERKIALIKREQSEIDSELKEAEGFDGDDPEIRALRRKCFSEFSVGLKALLERVENAATEALKKPAAEDTKAPAKIEEKKAEAQDTTAAAPVEEPKKAQPEEKKATEQDDAVQAPVEEQKKAAAPQPEERKAPAEEKKADAKETVAAPRPSKQAADTELLDEIAAREIEISDIQSRLVDAEQQRIQGKYIANLRETLKEQQDELAALKAALS